MRFIVTKGLSQFFSRIFFCQNEDGHAYRARPDLSSAQKNFRFRAPVGWANRKLVMKIGKNRQKHTFLIVFRADYIENQYESNNNN